jgi:hypothetical protein
MKSENCVSAMQGREHRYPTNKQMASRWIEVPQKTDSTYGAAEKLAILSSSNTHLWRQPLKFKTAIN